MSVSQFTITSPELERLIKATPEGMMFWATTCTKRGATCGGCRHYGYETDTESLVAEKHPSSCALYRKYAGHHGKPLSPEQSACKYFEDKNTGAAHRARKRDELFKEKVARQLAGKLKKRESKIHFANLEVLEEHRKQRKENENCKR